MNPKSKNNLATATKHQITRSRTSIPYGVKSATLRAAQMLTSPLSAESEWGQLLRKAQLSIGGWGCELLELRRCDRIVPMWCADFSTRNSTFSDAD